MLDIIKQTVDEYRDDKVPLLAAALAYFSAFSLAPLLILLITLLVFFGQGDAQSAILDGVRDAAGRDAAELVRSMIDGHAEGSGGAIATIVGVAVLLFASTTLFAQLKRTLNIIWHVEPEPETRLGGVWQLARERLLSLALIASLGLLLALALVLGTVVGAIVTAAGDAVPGGPAVWHLVSRLVAFGVLILAFTLVFRILPNADVPWGPTLIGASATALLFVVGTWGFGLYVSRVAIESAYGAAGSLVVLLLWVYVSAQIVLFGGELTQVLARRWGDGIQRPAQ